eukprot:GHVR01106508.1.p1 GENE.GHVR01106508.1~~GHVR01106508.1.p1  ORF type:complete len:139 (+),score=24.68 GHVR01106508.1:150-566(+)
MGNCFYKRTIDTTPSNPQQINARRRLSLSRSAEAKESTDGLPLVRGTTLFNLLENEENILQFFTNAQRKFSLSGAPAKQFQRGFDNKAHITSGDVVPLYDVGIGYACKKGWKPESPNQDDFFILRIDDWGLYGVFDGL